MPELPVNATKNFWLVKFAPFRTSWEEIVRAGSFTLRGVRSPAARKHLASMHVGDPVLFYRSQQDQAIVGVMEVIRAAYPDPTSADPEWLTCDFKPVRTLDCGLPLSAVKADPELLNTGLIRQPRLAVMPLDIAEFERIILLARKAPDNLTDNRVTHQQQ